MTDKDRPFDQLAPDRPLVKLLDLILQEGLLAGASTIELSTSSKWCRVRYQINGEWREQVKIPAVAGEPLLNVIRVRTRLDRTSVPRPHAGEMAVAVNDKPYRLTAEMRKDADGFDECLIHCAAIDAA